jgi:hypothetical protein
MTFVPSALRGMGSASVAFRLSKTRIEFLDTTRFLVAIHGVSRRILPSGLIPLRTASSIEPVFDSGCGPRIASQFPGFDFFVKLEFGMKRYILSIFAAIVSATTIGFAQGPGMPGGGPGMMPNDYHDAEPIQAGYVIVTPSAGGGGLVAFETFGMSRQTGFGMNGFIETMPAAVQPSEMTTSASVFVNTNAFLSRNLGLAICQSPAARAPVSL